MLFWAHLPETRRYLRLDRPHGRIPASTKVTSPSHLNMTARHQNLAEIIWKKNAPSEASFAPSFFSQWMYCADLKPQRLFLPAFPPDTQTKRQKTWISHALALASQQSEKGTRGVCRSPLCGVSGRVLLHEINLVLLRS
eukprot:3934207-Rhodomonas_salina.2